jgi:hypothetical protein
MHPLDSSLDASVHGRQSRTPRRSSLDNGACREDLLGLVSRSSGISQNNWMGQWYHYSSSSDEDIYASSSADEMDFGYGRSRGPAGPRRLSLNNCTSMNTTFLASTNYSVSTADKSDLDIDWHLETQKNCPPATDDSGSSVPPRNAADDEDDDDVDSFCDAEGAEPADQEYMRKDLGASCIWNDASEEPTVRRGGKKPLRGGEAALSNNSHNTTDSQNSNPIPEPLATDFVDMPPPPLVGQEEEEEEEVGLNATVQVVVLHEHPRDAEDLPDAAAVYDDDDDDDECDSFCDAHDQERANRDYLKKDLGASCYWSSNEDLEFCSLTTEEA